MELKYWQVECDENGVVVARYKNPPMNYMGEPGMIELNQLIEEWRNVKYRAIILAGGLPDKFVMHFDITEFDAYPPEYAQQVVMNGTCPAPNYRLAEHKLRTLYKPVFCAMNGDCMGGGLELALSCDIRIAQRGDYRYGLPETRTGLIPGGGGTQRITRLVNLSTALDMVLNAKLLKPEEAFEKGICQYIADDAVECAKELATRIAKRPYLAVARAKRCVYEGAETSLDVGMEYEALAFSEVMVDPASGELGAALFAHKPEDRRDFLETL